MIFKYNIHVTHLIETNQNGQNRDNNLSPPDVIYLPDCYIRFCIITVLIPSSHKTNVGGLTEA